MLNADIVLVRDLSGGLIADEEGQVAEVRLIIVHFIWHLTWNVS